MYEFNDLENKQGWMGGRAQVNPTRLANLVYKQKDKRIAVSASHKGMPLHHLCFKEINAVPLINRILGLPGIAELDICLVKMSGLIRAEQEIDW